MLFQIYLVSLVLLTALDLAARLLIGTLGLIFLVCKAVCSLHDKYEKLADLDRVIYFNSVNYPDELDCTPRL
jgi:hypothetical protein